MFALRKTNRHRQTKGSQKTRSRRLGFESMEPRILLSHKAGHEPPGGGGGGGNDPAPAEYSLVDLGTLPGLTEAIANDVNESGWVAGVSFISGVLSARAFVVVPTDLDNDGELDGYSNSSGAGTTCLRDYSGGRREKSFRFRFVSRETFAPEWRAQAGAPRSLVNEARRPRRFQPRHPASMPGLRPLRGKGPQTALNARVASHPMVKVRAIGHCPPDRYYQRSD